MNHMRKKRNLFRTVFFSVCAAILLFGFAAGAASAEITETMLIPADAREREYFGYAVAVSGDYAAVGASGDDFNEGRPGSVYVFRRDASGWTEQAKLTAPDDDGYDNFGKSVAISGNWLIAGAWGDDDRGNKAGAAYVFRRENTTWMLRAKLTASDAAAYDGFGKSVAISSDYALVGSPDDDDAANGSGSAYVFMRGGTEWIRQAKLTANDAAIYEYFGTSVGISGEYAVVGILGCKSCDGMPEPAGVAYVFRREGTVWTQLAKITAADAAARDLFGSAVGISGDYVIAGAPGDDDGGDDSGSAYIFRREGSVWTQRAKLTANDPEAKDALGESVAISGNYAIAGAWGGDDKGKASGSAYVFRRNGTVWTEHARLTASDGHDYDQLGKSVSLTDGYAIAGAPFANPVGSDSGEAYLYEFAASPDTENPTVPGNLSAEAISDSAVRLSWDVSSDNVAVAGYEVFRNEVSVGTATDTSYEDTGLLPLTAYAYGVRAYDAAGNRSEPSAAVSVTTLAPSPPRIISFLANPLSVAPGESTILTWDTSHADTCVIVPGIGTVMSQGSVTISPSETTAYTLTASGIGGSVTAEISVTVKPVPVVHITSVSNGSVISGPDMMVSGTVANTEKNETGVIVNGILAIVHGNEFVANHVPLEEGENTITVVATDSEGNTSESSVVISAVTTGEYIRLTAKPASGISPFETTLTLGGTFGFAEQPSLTYTGPGQAVVSEITDDNEYTVKMTTEGLWFFTAEVADAENNIFTDTIAVEVLSKTETDALLSAKWHSMREALMRNDIDKAVGYFANSVRDAVREVFVALSEEMRHQMAQDMPDIQFVRMTEGSAEYDLRKVSNGKTYSYYLLFVKDANGLWKIRSF